MEVQIPNASTIEKIKDTSYLFQQLRTEVEKVIVGHEQTITFIIIAILCDGHILLEGVPGVAKTTMIKSINQAIGLSFKRIQFTPDLLPADLIGTLIYNPKTQAFETRKGPIFANLILADEINRTPAKVQAALLEAMQEQQVTIGSNTYQLDKPFLVFATQNPIEQEGTYRLPEAQIDRFMFKLLISYPTREQEKQILYKTTQHESIAQALNKDDIFAAQELARSVYMDPKIHEYIVSIVYATREPKLFNAQSIEQYIDFGVSPRATIALYKASQTYAFLKLRHFVTPDDVKAVVPAILRHRLILSYEAEAEDITPDTIIQTILNKVPSP